MNYFANDCELSHYLKPLHQVILTKLFSQLSEVYSTIKIQAVVELLSPFKCSRFEIEQFAIHGCRIGSFRLTIDHSNGLFVFEDSNFCSKSLPVIELQSRLDEFSKRLVEVAALIDKDFNKTLAKQRKARFLEALENLERDRELTIERRNRMLENAEKRQDFLRTKEQERLQRVIELQQAEEARLAEHEKLLASQRLEQQRKEIERNESLKTAKKLVEELQALGIKVENEDLQNPDRLRDIQAEHIEKQRRELEIKARALAKKCDHTIRAFAREEIPLLEKEYKVQSVKDLEDYETSKLKSINEAKAKYVKILSLKKSLAHVMEDFSAYRKKMVDSRLAEYEAVKNESLKKLEEEKAARLSAHKLELAAKAKEEQDKIRQQQGIMHLI